MFFYTSLSKDMNGREDVFRAAAVRALCAITDNTTLQGIERYMKQAIVDKVNHISFVVGITSYSPNSKYLVCSFSSLLFCSIR